MHIKNMYNQIMKITKKIIFLFLITIIFLNSLFADSGNNVHELQLENGLTVFLLEDYDIPLIRIEYITKAGISSQNANNAGFYTLYSRIFESNLKSVSNFEVECNSDATRFYTTVPPSELKSTLDLISKTAFSPNFTDESIKNELYILKNEVLENENSLPGFINAAIDSRVFSGAPWKHDSGIYPALFSRIDYNQARITLNEISEKYYTPQNSAIFISGNIEIEKVKNLLDITFGIYYSSTGTPLEHPVRNINDKKKYVIHHPEMSDEMTQIVMQYTNLSPEQSDLAAAFLNNDFSTLKMNLLSNQKLSILGNEYINAAAARKKDSSRLILQSLLQSNSNCTPYEQVESFISITDRCLKNIYENEIQRAKTLLSANTNYIFENSTSFMQQLASYWAIKDFDSYTPDDIYYSMYQNSPTTAAMMARNKKINSVNKNNFDDFFTAEEPYIFVIMNSQIYAKYKKDFNAAGFEEISTKNASWYSQELFNQIKQAALDNFTEQNKRQNIDYDETKQNPYYNNNKGSINKFILSNNIPVYTKENTNSTFSTILLDIAGGKLLSSDNNGFEELMINLLASNIQNEINNKIYQQKITGNVFVFSNIQLTSSEIIIECGKEDFDQCINAISNSILSTEVIPAMADRIVSNLQYKKRLENGDATFQMFAHTISQLYGKKQLYSVYEAEKDILQKVNFDKISDVYSNFMNADRYSVIITGYIPENCNIVLEKELTKLFPIGSTATSIGKPNFPVKTQSYAKINHTFLTDVPASKAGKMPAKLVPTTEFIDPVIYIFKKPETQKEQELCAAYIYYMMDTFPALLTKNNLHIPITAPNKTSGNKNFTPKDCAITLPADNDIFSFYSMIFKNVAKAKDIEPIYIQEALSVLRKLSTITVTSTIIQDLKNAYFMHRFSDSNSNTGVAMLIKNSLARTELENPENFIESYNYIQEATATDFISVIEKYFIKPELIIYSTDAKK